jgi:membrane fusion protein (multidrug efflux system)
VKHTRVNAFPRTLRSIAAAEARPRRLVLVVALVGAAAWLAWFLAGQVTVVETSNAARLEVDSAPHPLDAPVSGLVVASHLELDREVKAGEILVELDTRLEQLRLEEEQARVTSLSAQLERARAEVAATEAADRTEARTSGLAVAEAQAAAKGAEATAGLSRVEQETVARLYEKKGVAGMDVKRAEAERVAREQAAISAAAGAARLELEGKLRVEDARSRREKLLREVTAIEGDLAVSRTTVERLTAEIDRRKLRAPVDGRLGQVMALAPGATLVEGQRVALVVPAGDLRIVSRFPVASAVGRVRAGQLARVRLDGFPFTVWGSLRARVKGVGTEAEQGLVRVDLEVVKEGSAAIPLQHGLTGVVEVEVEHLSPAALVLRLAGRALQGAASGASRFPVSGAGGNAE